MQNLDELKIELNTSISVDQRRYNAPLMDQVAAIWQDGSDEKNKFKWSTMVFSNSGDHNLYGPTMVVMIY